MAKRDLKLSRLIKKLAQFEGLIAVRDKGVPVEYFVAPDEGHGFARPINNLAMVTEIEKVLAKYLDGRYQESVPSDVRERCLWQLKLVHFGILFWPTLT